MADHSGRPLGMPLGRQIVTSSGAVTASNIPKYADASGNLLTNGFTLDTDATMAANSDTSIASQKAMQVYIATVPANNQSANYTTVLLDAGRSIDHPSTDANARTFTIAANASVAYPVGTCISFSNMTANVVTIAINSDTMYLAGTGTTGSRSLAQYGVATARKLTSTTWLIGGSGLT